MATQLQPGLFDAPRKLSHAERFELFHARNPQVYRAICRYARRAKERGHTRYSLKTIWCVLRFEEHMRVERDGEYELNDAFTAYYARLVMKQEPDLAGYFELRERRKR